MKFIKELIKLKIISLKMFLLGYKEIILINLG